ncbi:MAG: cation diffusion facilitator CzcD-associated flavoprotein CzcO [Cyclobacteriaceae bacterium]|jgi:cation diffusion facilitator CzcD-associated flavoprotein CzcO
MSSHTQPSIDKATLLAKYRAERDKRLRADGSDQYLEIKEQLGHYLDDPYTPMTEREPKTDHVAVAIIGGGFSGLVTSARLKEAGISDVRVIEKGGDFGGTWYWNRYPGAQCDTASFVYMPLLEETGHMPTEKYAHGPEILAHCQHIGRHFDLYDNALFHTEVCELIWIESKGHWSIKTNRGDAFTAQFVTMGTGPLHVPKLPGIDGIESFKGHSFHTSRWDYEYTGGDNIGAPMVNLADKRVAIIGTGATSVQCVPHLAKACKELLVFQRTPSSIDVRNNQPTDPEWFKDMATSGWQQRWLDNFTAVSAGAPGVEDLVMDGWTDLAKRIIAKLASLPRESRTQESMMAAFEDADFEKMDEIRSRVDTIVTDTDTAANLKAWYFQLCKRPCFHDQYLQAFNEPAARLIDTDGQGVERITERGLVVGGVEYPVDCIIYASGFEVGTAFERRAGYDTTGRDGQKLSDYWSEGMRTKHGTHVHGFPNAFIVQGTQGANLISNYPHNLTESGRTIAAIIKHAVDHGHSQVEVTKEAEDAWLELLLQASPSMLGSPDCTPGYYNNEGQTYGLKAKLNVGYPAGPMEYFKYLAKWRGSGEFDGLAFK